MMKGGLFNPFFQNGADIAGYTGMGSGAQYSSSAQAVFAQMPDAMPAQLKNAIATFVDDQVAAGNWSKIIDFGYFGMNTEANSFKSFKGIATPVNHGTQWNIYSSITTDGASSYVDLGFIPNNVSSFALNDCGIGTYVQVNQSQGATSNALFGCIETASNTRQLLILQSGSSGSTITGRVNVGNTNITYSSDNIFDNYSLYAVERTASNSSAIYKNSTSLATASTVSSSKAQISVFLGARNQDGVANTFTKASFKFFVIYNAVGFDHASFSSASNQLIQNIDAIIPFVPVVLDIGQSNSVGKAETTRMVGLTSYTTTPSSSNFLLKSGYNNTADGAFVKMVIGTSANMPPQESVGYFGAEASLSQKIFSNKNVPVWFVKAGRGGTSLAQTSGTYTDWDPTSGSTDCFTAAMDGLYIPALAKVQAEYPNNILKTVILWHQGEADATDTRADSYSTNFAAFVTAVRSKHTSLATAPLIITKLYFNLNSGETTINNVFTSYVGGNANSYLIDPASQVQYPRKIDLPSDIKATYPPIATDDNHDSYQFQIKKGEMIYDKLVEIGFF